MSSPQVRLNLETLEERDTPSAGAMLIDGTLLVTGGNQAAIIRVFDPAGDTGKVEVDITSNGTHISHTFDQSNVKNLLIFGGKGNDTITNDTGINAVIFGGRGSDTIWGGSGDNLIYTGKGNDVVHSGTGNDVILEGKGNDVVYAGSGHDVIFAGKGKDVVYGSTGNNIVYASKGEEVVLGGKGLEKILDHKGDHEAIFDLKHHHHEQIWALDHIDALIKRLETTLSADSKS
jgi:Ca2+-binding RTX toxin-like protein